ncbi:MAG TPA: outer membrane beta-barrel protein [Chryseosolibacter sp.]|nr:outer membrane beta-barrel protein [Chryseosolibacter sp.]
MKVKSVLFLAVIMLTSSVLKAQDEFKKFRVGIGLGYAMASGKGSSGGVLFDIEPGYRITDQILVNLRYENAVIVRGSATETEVDLDAAGIGSYTLNGQYYFGSDMFRPYVGLGFGLYSLAAISVNAGSTGGGADVSAENKFGVYPRVGFDFRHFTMNLDYNIIPNTTGEAGTEFKNSYIGIRIGGYFGGGRN